MNLLEINKAIEDVINNSFHIDEATGEVFEADDLNKLKVGFNDKIDAIAYYIKNEETMAEAIKKEADSLTKRAKSHQKKADSLRNYLAFVLNNAGYAKHETAKNKFYFRTSKSLFVEDEEAFKKKYTKFCDRKFIKTIDKRKVTEAIKNGELFKGAFLKETKNLKID